MTIIEQEFTDLQTPTGVMRTHLLRPAAAGRYPGIILYSEIYQATGPIRRTAAWLAGHGFVVAIPEIFHEYEAPGTALLYDTAGTDRGNWCKANKPFQSYDADTRAVIAMLAGHSACTGRLGALGICIGGHLAFRCAMQAEIQAAICFYATDIHKIASHPRGLGPGMADDSLERARRGDIQGELLMIWGRQDPHVPFEGRAQVQGALEASSGSYQWLEFNAAHAFMRDEGPRYNPALARHCYSIALEVLERKLKDGGQKG